MNKTKMLTSVIFGVIVAWIIISDMTFAYRHPWATETERAIHLKDAVLFRKIPYNEMRPRE